MKSRNPNLDWMRNILADLERSRSDPRIAALMAGFNEPSPNIAADGEAEGFDRSPSDHGEAIQTFRPPER
jgi:hypothetical protein